MNLPKEGLKGKRVIGRVDAVGRASPSGLASPPRPRGRPKGGRVDAVGFEPTASPLQGERSTADLRAPLGAARFALRYFNDSSQAVAHGWIADRSSRESVRCLLRSTDGHRCLLHSTQRLSHWTVSSRPRRKVTSLGGDPSAGSPTDTLLRLNPPCRAQV